MATAWIRCYSSVKNFGAIQVCEEPGTDLANVTFSTTERSVVIPEGVKYVGISASADFHYKVGGSTVTAATTDLKVSSSNAPYFVGVSPGQYIAFIAAA
ncbi:hypothetical protein [Bradyrhizobium icense]|uniref:Uncharacterized protein n=1 Tax=Bradyrhizobium icense TaxID=1274631 RepID=A0A1B1UD35_9BRAD|nr:hypothetical protein [Bradyrhizobium icense]ANW00679.1 hypothetical protein LMTR13_11370 [Bradyrhizobium icense]